ncbi:MAG: AsmA family protein [Deltaproteobacteria bacterium]|nr:AsmA family protein [Deltaproteobacteria bacterium]
MKSKRKTHAIRWKPIFISFAVLTGLSIITIYIILFNYDLEDLKPHIFKLVENATGRELIIDGNIHLQVSLAPRIIIEDIALRNAQWGSNQNMIQAKRVKLQVALLPLLSNKIIIRQLVISEPDILLEVGHNGKTNFEFKKPSNLVDKKVETVKEKKGWPIFGSKKIIIENGRFAYNDLRNKESYTVKIRRLTLSGKDIEEPLKVKLSGLYNNQIILAEGKIGPLPALSDPSEQFVLNILIKAGGNSLFLDGRIQDITSIQGLTIDVESKIKNPIFIEKLIGQPFPIKKPFEISGKLEAHEAYSYKIQEFSFTSQNIVFNGSIDINIKGKRPRVKAVIAAEELNLIPLILDSRDVKRKPVSDTAKKKESRVFPNDLLPEINFSVVDADVQLQARSIVLPEIAFNYVYAIISIKDRRLHVDAFKADMGPGTLNGYFHLNPTKNMWHMEIAMKAEQLPLNLLVPTRKVTDSLEGDIDMLFSLTAHGKSVAEIMSNLNGDVGLSMCDGKIATKYIDFLGTDFSTGLVKTLNPFKKRTDHTEVNCFVCILDITKGMAQTKALVLDTGRAITIGRGRVDFTSEKLDISLKSIPKEGIGLDKIGKISISLSELYKPVKISGTLARPSLTIDLTQTAITLTKVAGGVALLGPAGIALALVTARIGDDNPCLEAVEAVKHGSKEKGLTYDKKEGIFQRTTNSIVERLKKLLGRVIKNPEKKSLA